MAKIDDYKKKLSKRSSYKDYIGLSLKAYKKHKLTKDSEELMSAVLIAQEGFNLYPSCLLLLLLCAFLYIEVEALSDAKDIIDRLKPYRGYYKNNDVSAYITHAYLSALCDIKMKNTKGALRQVKQMEKRSSDFCELFIGHVYFEMGDYQKSLNCLEESHKKGVRSFFLYVLYSYMCGKAEDSGYLFIPLIKWSLRQGIMCDGLIEQNGALIRKLMPGSLQNFRQIYESTGSELLLSLICEKQVSDKDITEEAYKYYKALEHRQLEVRGVSEKLILCAHAHEDERVLSHTLRSFLAKSKMDEEILPFILHLILTNADLSELIFEFGLDDLILRAGEWAIENSFTGRTYNSIYRYFMENSTESLEKVELLVYRDLFLANVYINNVDSGFLYVHEPEQQNMEIYEFENGFKQIKTIAGNVRIDIIDKSTGMIVNADYSLSRQVENADSWLYKYYIDRGYNDPALYMALSGLYIKSNEPSAEYIDILNKTLEISSLSTGFRMKVGGELGNILSVLARHDKALEYFNRVNESHLDQRYIGTMLVAFINAYDFKKAAQLIIKKREYISDRTLLWALKEMADDYRNNMNGLIADAAYELLVKNWYAAKLLNIVIKYYVGSSSDWYLLRDALSKMGLYNLALDKKILTNSLWIRDFGEASLAVFNRLYTNEKEKALTSDYIYYACYEIIIGERRPVYEFIVNLEDYYEKTGEPVVAYALSLIYLRYSIKTFKSHEIQLKTIDFMEEEAVLLPEFKNAGEFESLYVEKNWPFVYKADAQKTVFLHYKTEAEAEYSKKTMKHLFFGIFCAAVPVFFNEKMEYYFSEETETGFVNTEVETIISAVSSKINADVGANDMFFSINKAIINEKAFRHAEVEKIISELLKDGPEIRGRLL